MNDIHSPDAKSAIAPAPVPGIASALDIPRGLTMLGSDAALRKILKTVCNSMVTSLPDIQQALQAGDVPSANRLLHSLKGYLPIFATDALVEHVSLVEKISKTESIATVLPLYADLAPHLENLLADIQRFLSPPA